MTRLAIVARRAAQAAAWGAVLALGAPSGAAAQGGPADPVGPALRDAGLREPIARALRSDALPRAPRDALAWVAQLRAEPLRAGARVVALDHALDHALGHAPAAPAGAPGALLGQLAALTAPVGFLRPVPNPVPSRAAPTLDQALAELGALAPDGATLPPLHSQVDALPEVLAAPLARLLHAIAHAERARRRAFAALPPALTREALVAWATDTPAAPAVDVPAQIAAIDRRSLQAGMRTLVDAAGGFVAFLERTPSLPAVDWHLDTPLGAIVIDTLGTNRVRTLPAPLLLVDVGGDDQYRFLPRAPGQAISVLIEHGGNDRYAADDAGADPSAAVLGYGVLWDTGGDDRHEGTRIAQAAALFGNALLVDGGGDDLYAADANAQGWALGGSALLLERDGRDRYAALSQAQGAGGPGGVALLLDRAGDDTYVLGNERVIVPSAQWPERNASLGQGAGYGLRDQRGGASYAGGLGLLIDRAGNDRYEAQVFAQGAGYGHGAGVLIDGGGADTYAAAWYGQGAAAHGAVGVLLDVGEGEDRYAVEQSTGQAAAHDGSLALLVDAAGAADFQLGDLGLGAAHDGGVAILVAGAERSRFTVSAPRCRAFGVAEWTEAPSARPAVGAFVARAAQAGAVAPPCAPPPRPRLAAPLR